MVRFRFVRLGRRSGRVSAPGRPGTCALLVLAAATACHSAPDDRGGAASGHQFVNLDDQADRLERQADAQADAVANDASAPANAADPARR